MQQLKTRPAWWFAVLSALALIAEGASAVHRGGLGKSDISVFYRTAVLLSHGAGGALYEGRDAVSHWYRCIPPAGLMWFAPLAGLSARGASLVWLLENLGFAALGVWSLCALLRELEQNGDSNARAAMPFAAGLFFLMASPSVEVGQYSLMFASMWLFATWCATRQKWELSAFALALPAAIKIYPALLLLAPLCVLPPKKWPRFALSFAVGCAFWTWIAPLPFYGARVPELQSAFWREVVLSPTGRLSESQSVSSTSSHGLDTMMLRFGSNAPEPLVTLPHLNFSPSQVLRLVNPLRALLIAVALAFWMRRFRRIGNVRSWLDSLALWSATLFLILPGAKARYAVYAFAAFLPLVLHGAALFRVKASRRWFYVAFISLLGVLVLSLVSTTLRVWGAGFWGALALWIENGRLLRRAPLESVEEKIATAPSTLPLPAKT